MLNFTVVQGRMVADPELRYTQTQTPVCYFRVAWSERIKENENKLFLNCVAWRGTAELISKYWRKGREIVVEGKLNTNQWKDKDGNPRSETELIVQKAHFCGPKERSEQAPQQPNKFVELTGDFGDLPF